MKKLLIEYNKAIIHMREQIALNRFGLVFGAGISCQFGFPTWKSFITDIAENKEIKGSDLISISRNNLDISQMLYHRLQLNTICDDGFEAYDKKSSYYKSKWLRIVHDELYKNVPLDVDELKKKDKYIKNYLDIIKKTRLTINYNFDNTIEILLGEHRDKNERERTRGFRTVWNSDIQLYPQNGVIYHPNGFIPRDFSERPSDDIVFLEDSFGDQLIDSLSGHYNALSNFYSQNTCLLIGLSLEDTTLKHILRNNSKIHPGHVHYYVYFLPKKDALTEEQKESIRISNFEVYNLVTLFLEEHEISTLGQLLGRPSNLIEEQLDELGGYVNYRYYLTGSVSVGKSTAISNFRSLKTHDEWLDQKIKGMEKDPTKVLNPSTIEEIDKFIAEQWRTKNFLLSTQKSGVHVIDRAPLDAFAFTPEDQWVSKAKLTKSIVTPGKSKKQLCKGQIIFLIGDPNVMSNRALKLQKDVTPDNLKYRQELLKIIYNKKTEGIIELDTRDKNIAKVTKDICRIIHLSEYNECDMQDILDKIEKEQIKPQTK